MTALNAQLFRSLTACALFAQSARTEAETAASATGSGASGRRRSHRSRGGHS